MRTKIILLTILVLTVIAVSPVMGVANLTASRELTASGPSGLLIPLGIENYVPLSLAYTYYNLGSLIIIGTIAAFASLRTTRFIMIGIPIAAGLFTYFGWLSDHTTSTSQAALWGRIIFLGFFGSLVYLSETKRANYGSKGPGITITNIVLYLIILQASIGMVNGFDLFGGNNAATTPSEYQNVDLGNQMTEINTATGITGSIGDIPTFILTSGVMAFKLLINIVVTLAFFSVTIYAAYPWLIGNTWVAAFLIPLQLAIWFGYAIFFYSNVWLKTSDGGLI